MARIKELKSETHESMGFVNIANQVRDPQKSDLRMSQNNTNTTFIANHSYTPPLAPPGERESEQVKATSVTSPKHQNRQEKGNPIPVSQEVINSQVTQFADVVKRPARVEQKINKDEVVQETVRTKVYRKLYR